MKLRKLWIENYKKYVNSTIDFTEELDVNKLQKEIFGEMNIILFSGENGSGKTTILSFIVYIFKYIQRFRERLTSDYVLEYDIELEGILNRVILKKNNTDIYITINGNTKYIKEFTIKNGQRYINSESATCEQVTIEDIRDYLPAQVFVLGNDLGYSNIDYASRYIGERIIDSGVQMHGSIETARGYGISLGIAYVYNKCRNNSDVNKILKSWGVRLADFVDIYLNTENNGALNNYLYETDVEYNKRFKIVKFLEENSYEVLEELIENQDIYINEFYIAKKEGCIPIRLMSTGEKAFLFNLFYICSNLIDNSIVIWEEPETHLNMKWSKQLIPLLTALAKNKKMQWLFSSHSTYLIKYLFQNQIIRLETDFVGKPNFNTFLANDTEINNKLFNDNHINYFEKQVIDVFKNADNSLKQEIFGELGESYFRFILYKSMET